MGNENKRTWNQNPNTPKRQHAPNPDAGEGGTPRTGSTRGQQTPNPNAGKGGTPRTGSTRDLTVFGDNTSVRSQDPDGEHAHAEDVELRSKDSVNSSSAHSLLSGDETEQPEGTQSSFTVDESMPLSQGDTPTIHERVAHDCSSPSPTERNSWDHSTPHSQEPAPQHFESHWNVATLRFEIRSQRGSIGHQSTKMTLSWWFSAGIIVVLEF